MTAHWSGLRKLGIAATGLLVLVVILVGLLQLPPVATAVVRKLLTFAPLAPGNRLEVSRVSGNVFGGLTLEDVRLRQSGDVLATVDRLRIAYAIPDLLGDVRRLDRLEIAGARVAAHRGPRGWDVQQVLRASPDTTAGGGGFAVRQLRVRDAAVTATLSPDSTARLRVLDLTAHDLTVADTTTVVIDSVALAVQPPASGRWFAVTGRGALTPELIRLDPLRIQTENSRLAGHVILPRSFERAQLVDLLDVRLAAEPLDLADLSSLVPAVPSEGQLHLDAAAAGQGDLVTAHLAASLDSARIRLDGDTRLRRGRPQGYRVHGTMRALDPSRLYASAPAGALNGRLDADVEGPLRESTGTVRLNLTRSRVGTTGLRRLELDARLDGGAARLELDGAMGTAVVRAEGRARPFDSLPSYHLAGSARGLPGTAPVARALAGSAGDPALRLAFTVAGQGWSPDSARLRGRVTFTAVRDDGSRTPLGHTTLRLAEGTLDLRPALVAGGGTITAVGRLTLGDTLRYELGNGRITRVDLARLAGDTAAAPLSGRFRLAGSGTAPEQARITAHVDLDQLRYGDRRLEQVAAVARVSEGRVTVNGHAALQGGRLTLDAAGRPFDSAAVYTVRRAALDSVDLGTFLGYPALAGPVSLSLSGRARLAAGSRSLQARVALSPSRLGTIAVTGGNIGARLAGGRLKYDVSLHGPAGTLALAGDGTPGADTPVYHIRQGRLTGAQLGALLDRPDLETDLALNFTGAFVADSSPRRRAAFDAELLPSRVNQARLSGGRLAARLSGQSLEGTLRATGPDLALDARVHAVPDGAGSVLETNGTLRVERLARWTGRRDADGRIESGFALRIERDSSGVRTVGGKVDALGGVGGVRVPGFHVALTPSPGALRVDTLVLRSNVAVLDGAGGLALRPGAAPDTLALAGTLGDLAPVAELAGVDTVAFDSARVSLTASGPSTHRRFGGRLDAHGTAVAGNLADHVTFMGAASFDGGRVAAVAGDLRVQDAAYGRLTVPELTLAGKYDSTVALDLNLNVADSVRVATRVRGAVSQARDTVTAEIQQLTLDEGGRAWALQRPAAFTWGPSLQVHDLVLRAGERSIALDGVLDRQGTSDMTLRIAGLDLETLQAAGLVPIGGRLDGQLRLEGPGTAPRLHGRTTLTILSDKRRIGTLATDLDWGARGMQVAAEARPERGGAVSVTGSLPYRLTLAPRDTMAAAGTEPTGSDTVALTVRADSFDLSLFQPLLPHDAVRDLTGRLAADARIRGTIRAPQAAGGLDLTGAGLVLPSINVTYDHGELSGRLDGETLQIQRLALRTGKDETLAARGSVRLRPLSAPALDLAGTLDRFKISDTDQLQTSASGQVRLAGTLLRPELTGTLRLGRTNFFVGNGASSARVEQVVLTPEQIRQLARDFGPQVLGHAKETPGLLDRTGLDLGLRFPGQVWIRRSSSPEMDIELTGGMRLQKPAGGDYLFSGHVEPVPQRGTIEFSGRQFRLTGGDIYLAGPVDSTRLDVNATYQVPVQGEAADEGVVIDVHAHGTLDSMALEFSSDPELSQDDILSYIVTGRPASDNPLFEGSGRGTSGTQIALGTLTTALSNAAGEQLGFDVFQLRQDPARGLTLTAGRYLGPRLFLDLQLPLQLGTLQRQSSGANLGPGFELEYRLERWLRAELRGGSLSPGFLFRGRRAY